MFGVLVAGVKNAVAYLGGVWGHRDTADASLVRAKVEARVVCSIEAVHHPCLSETSEDLGLVPQLVEYFVGFRRSWCVFSARFSILGGSSWIFVPSGTRWTL